MRRTRIRVKNAQQWSDGRESQQGSKSLRRDLWDEESHRIETMLLLCCLCLIPLKNGSCSGSNETKDVMGQGVLSSSSAQRSFRDHLCRLLTPLFLQTMPGICVLLLLRSQRSSLVVFVLVCPPRH